MVIAFVNYFPKKFSKIRKLLFSVRLLRTERFMSHVIILAHNMLRKQIHHLRM